MQVLRCNSKYKVMFALFCLHYGLLLSSPTAGWPSHTKGELILSKAAIKSFLYMLRHLVYSESFQAFYILLQDLN